MLLLITILFQTFNDILKDESYFVLLNITRNKFDSKHCVLQSEGFIWEEKGRTSLLLQIIHKNVA